MNIGLAHEGPTNLNTRLAGRSSEIKSFRLFFSARPAGANIRGEVNVLYDEGRGVDGMTSEGVLGLPLTGALGPVVEGRKVEMAGGTKQKSARVGAASCVVALVLVMVWAGDEARAQAEPAVEERSSCDLFMESYARSAARKLDRAMSTGDYALEALDGLGETLRLDGELVGLDSPLVFDVYKEASGRVAGLVDQRREWTQTYIVAVGRSGPIIMSHTWQARRLREAGQPCEPFTSAVEWPGVTSSTVDVEPFKFWGLRASWRIPRADDATSERGLEAALIYAARRYEGLAPVEVQQGSGARVQGEGARDVTKD